MNRFTNQMKKYLGPGIMGINRLCLYIDGYQRYLKSIGEEGIYLKEVEADEDATIAKKILCQQIDNNIIVPILVLRHKNPKFREYVCYWFVLAGYESRQERLWVTAIRMGKATWIDFEDLWDSGYQQNGGLTIYKIKIILTSNS